MLPKFNQLSRDEALAMIPAEGAVRVLQQPARFGSEVLKHTWHADFARARVERMSAFRTFDPSFEGYGLYFQDQDGNIYYIETQPAAALPVGQAPAAPLEQAK